MKTISIGLIGFGTIGAGVVKILQSERAAIARATGVNLKLEKICDLDIASDRGVKVERSLLTKNAADITENPDIDIVIELVGGTTFAKKIILDALARGKHVVTANKALLAEAGDAIFKQAAVKHVHVRFEAAVAGGIPIIKSVTESLIANNFKRIIGIVNGTSNYILWNMTRSGLSFAEALKQAQAKGFAEADPTLDINGADAAHKLALLTMLAFKTPVQYKQVIREGLDGIDGTDIAHAETLGYAVKLLAIAKSRPDGIECRVHPTLIPKASLLASVANEFNAIYIDGDKTGEQLFYGKGAGSLPTASAVVSDLVDIGKQIMYLPDAVGTKKSLTNDYYDFFGSLKRQAILPRDAVNSRYYFRFMTVDKPGVLAKIAAILGKNSISISSVVQKEIDGNLIPIIILTHKATEKNIISALSKIDKLPEIKKKTIMYRIEDI